MSLISKPGLHAEEGLEVRGLEAFRLLVDTVAIGSGSLASSFGGGAVGSVYKKV